MSASAAKKETGKKSPLPLIMGAIIVLLVLALGAKTMMGSKKEEKSKKKEPAEVGAEMPLDEFLVNLHGNGDHYLKVTVALGLKKGLSEEEAKHHIAPMRDAILTVLSAKSMKELNEAKDREALKEELKTKINESAPEEPVAKVYFTAFAMQ